MEAFCHPNKQAGKQAKEESKKRGDMFTYNSPFFWGDFIYTLFSIEPFILSLSLSR
jgi:hypothetical protein